jgi:hypothetical protein
MIPLKNLDKSMARLIDTQKYNKLKNTNKVSFKAFLLSNHCQVCRKPLKARLKT